jgi:hypothetical protein
MRCMFQCVSGNGFETAASAARVQVRDIAAGAKPKPSTAKRPCSQARHVLALECFAGRETPPIRLFPAGGHTADIAADLALKSHLLRAGYRDAWGTRTIGQKVTPAFYQTFGSTLPVEYPDIERFAVILWPYRKLNAFNIMANGGAHDRGPGHAQVLALLRCLRDRVGDAIGYTRSCFGASRQTRY